MSLKKLTRLDLNLLITLHILLECNSVSKAAKQLNLSQSAVSKSLARLRVAFDDALFERSGYGMQPTPKAQQLRPELTQLMNQLEKFTAPNHFDPQQSTRRFKIAAVESIYSLLFPRFIGDALSQAPHITIETSNWHRKTFEQLQSGELDFAITGKDLSPQDAAQTLLPPKGIVADELYQNRLCCLLHPNHPALSHTWDLGAYISYRHIMTKYYENERWLLDLKLEEMGTQRDTALYVPDFNSAAELCTHTELILTIPDLFAQHIASKLNLRILPLPFELPPLSVSLFWHQNREKDQAHIWLKQLITESSLTIAK